jgi:MSHA biogenesis protein MshI
LQPDGVYVVRVERAGGRPPAITDFDFQPWDGDDHLKTLTKISAAHDLKHSRCTTTLDLSDYSLLLTEAPDVPAEELRAALRWRIKDLIDFHINDATLDVFDVPGEAAAGRARPMYAVAARSTAIQSRVDQLTQAGVNLDIIDIPELAQRNLAALLPQDAKGVVVLSLWAERGLITITRQGELYLSRNLEMGVETLLHSERQADYFDRIVLEVQRSMDYYDSHFRQAPITHLAIAPLLQPIPGLIDYLKANLNVTVSEMDIMQFVECPQSIPAQRQARCLATIGAALRQEEKAL